MPKKTAKETFIPNIFLIFVNLDTIRLRSLKHNTKAFSFLCRNKIINFVLCLNI